MLIMYLNVMLCSVVTVSDLPVRVSPGQHVRVPGGPAPRLGLHHHCRHQQTELEEGRARPQNQTAARDARLQGTAVCFVSWLCLKERREIGVPSTKDVLGVPDDASWDTAKPMTLFWWIHAAEWDFITWDVAFGF